MKFQIIGGRHEMSLSGMRQFAIFISVCNFHISLQFSLFGGCIVPTWTFAIFIWVCNFHMSLQFSYQFAILTSRLQNFLRTRLHMDSHVPMNFNS
jgi:hypothetical protein